MRAQTSLNVPAPESQNPRPKIDFSGQIPKVYEPSPGTNLLGRRWWKEMSAKDALWKDLVGYIPLSVLNRRIKSGHVSVITDIEEKAEHRAQKRRQKENVHVITNSETDPEPVSKESTGPPNHSVDDGDSNHAQDAGSGDEELNDNGLRYIKRREGGSGSRVEKGECAQCGEFLSRDQMERDSNGNSICSQCRDPVNVNEESVVVKQEVKIKEEPRERLESIEIFIPRRTYLPEPIPTTAAQDEIATEGVEISGGQMKTLDMLKRKMDEDGEFTPNKRVELEDNNRNENRYAASVHSNEPQIKLEED